MDELITIQLPEGGIKRKRNYEIIEFSSKDEFYDLFESNICSCMENSITLEKFKYNVKSILESGIFSGVIKSYKFDNIMLVKKTENKTKVFIYPEIDGETIFVPGFYMDDDLI